MFGDLLVLFPVSGVKTYLFLPPLVAMVISFFTSMGGVSGAFLLLPFQMSILHYTTPSVSATNLVYNIIAIPSGVYRFIREGRMAWPLTWVVVIGTLPGVFIGYYLRVMYLPDPRTFKFFAGCVLLYIGMRLFFEFSSKSSEKKNRMKALDEKFRERLSEMKQEQKILASGLPREAVVTTRSAGGFVGIYLGARLQKFVPQKFIRLLLGVMILFIAMSYITQFLFLYDLKSPSAGQPESHRRCKAHDLAHFVLVFLHE